MQMQQSTKTRKRFDREAVTCLLKQEESIDLIIPRSGEGLIRFVVQNSSIPVLKHYKGVCHVYVVEGADIDMAENRFDHRHT